MLWNCGDGGHSWESVGLKGDQSILKEIIPEYSLEELMLNLQYFSHLVPRANSFKKDFDAGKDWRQEEKGMTEDEIVGWHHQLNGREFEQAPWEGEGQGCLAHYSPRGRKYWTRLSDWTTEHWCVSVLCLYVISASSGKHVTVVLGAPWPPPLCIPSCLPVLRAECPRLIPPFALWPLALSSFQWDCLYCMWAGKQPDYFKRENKKYKWCCDHESLLKSCKYCRICC